MSIEKHQAAYEHHMMLGNGHHVKASDIETEGSHKVPHKSVARHNKLRDKHYDFAKKHKAAIKKLGGKVKGNFNKPFSNYTPVNSKTSFKSHAADKLLERGHLKLIKAISLANDMLRKA